MATIQISAGATLSYPSPNRDSARLDLRDISVEVYIAPGEELMVRSTMFSRLEDLEYVIAYTRLHRWEIIAGIRQLLDQHRAARRRQLDAFHSTRGRL